MTLQLAIKIGGDASGFHAAATATVRDFQQVGDAADISAEKVEAARKAAGGYAFAMQSLKQQSDAVTQAGVAQTAAVQRFRDQLDPLATATRQAAESTAQLQGWLAKGLINQAEYDAGVGRIRTGLERMGVAIHETAGRTGRFGLVLQQAGYQISDIAAVAAMGGNVFATVGVQAGQFIGMFGPWGAVLGAAATVGGILATTLLDTKDALLSASEAQELFNDAVRAGKDLTENAETAARRHAEESRDRALALLTEAYAQEQLNIARSKASLAANENWMGEQVNEDLAKRATNTLRGAEGRAADIQGQVDSLLNPAPDSALYGELNASSINKAMGLLDQLEERTRKASSAAEHASKARKETIRDLLLEAAATERLSGAMGGGREALEAVERANFLAAQVAKGGAGRLDELAGAYDRVNAAKREAASIDLINGKIEEYQAAMRLADAEMQGARAVAEANIENEKARLLAQDAVEIPAEVLSNSAVIALVEEVFQ